jgi:homocysteine S-methyltransferase
VLADGSEYSGHYDINADELVDFHLPRWQILAGTDADLFACETIPSRREGRALLRLLENTPEVWAWLSFSCQDGQRLSNGSAMADVARDCDAVERVAAIGVNCTAPEFVTELLGAAREGTSKPLIAYPNSGERYDPAQRGWVAGAAEHPWGESPREWKQRGAVAIGGCCRVIPEQITAIRNGLGI